ncbi:glycosyltransferase family 2 protein [Aphanothece sacrum]|uniref:glycosyltransferase family 2 protein n=1 Tax=Aphanothece sacrum TaxID=1122 RepID=UPI001D130E6F|nr:glycosyltransferase family 2 protein [Aphanothece sacrum]
MASLCPSKPNYPTDHLIRPSAVILIPAHNEAKVISESLDALLTQLMPQDKIVVIADNCSDQTAEIVKEKGLTVIERQNSQQRGKGYAVDYGLKFLESNPPEVVVILDADSLMEANTLDYLVKLAYAKQKPIQSTYLMKTDLNPSMKDRISAFAIMVKNLVRPYGLTQFNMPCLLNGSGMAFPWSIIRQVPVANNHTVDDMQLSVDLAIAGYAPYYCPQGQVMGRLMQQDQGKSQRTRWEHGHLSQILIQVPHLLQASVKQQRLDLLILALELAVPPLSVLVIFWLSFTSFSLIAAIVGFSWFPFLMFLIQGLLILVSIIGSWFKFGQSIIPGMMLLAIPQYLIWKLPIYLNFLQKPEINWNKTERD